MKNISQLLVTLLMAGTSTFAQQGKEIKANQDYQEFAFIDAIQSYEYLVTKGYSSEDIYTNLGNANYHNANYKEAANWYNKLIDLKGETNIDPQYLFRYAQTLKSTGDYNNSYIYMQKFAARQGNDHRAKLFLEQKDYLEKINNNSNRYHIENLTINSEESDFAPSFYGDSLVYSSARQTGKISKNIHRWNNKAFLDLYLALPEEKGFVFKGGLNKEINKKSHESSTAFTKDGTTVYFTRNNFKNGKFKRDLEGLSRLKIFRATLNNDKWDNITELPFNSETYSVAHPALSADGSKLYFVSDMPGTIGDTDIYVIDINNDGTYGSPKNLGAKVNTEARESFPYVTESGILYFASDGHPGLGGLDVFATKLDDLNNTKVVNLGKPINSKEDDFSFIIKETTKKGFFASNRETGIGGDDIYGFTEVKPLNFDCSQTIGGVVKDIETGTPIAKTSIAVYNFLNELILKTRTSNQGVYSFKIDCTDKKLTVAVVGEGYKQNKELILLNPQDSTYNHEIFLQANKKEKEKEKEKDLGKTLNLNPIYFNFNQALITDKAKFELDKVVVYMLNNPTSIIQVNSHTDSRGNDDLNMKLSSKRAKATVQYIIFQGISPQRISGKGFGETKLLNHCDNAANCSPDEHEINRRSEFIVVSF